MKTINKLHLIQNIILLIIAFLFLSACSSSVRFSENKSYKKNSSSATNKPNNSDILFENDQIDDEIQQQKHSGFLEEGFASYYGPGFDGRKTASGEVFDKNKLTAAHRTLPFGTVLVVTNLRNGKKVIVTINDRGPHKAGRIIDLSEAAAKEIDMIRDGVVPVEIRTL